MIVKVNRFYTFNPVPFDQIFEKATAAPGQMVKVINLPGAPKANTMGQCYIESVEGDFLGMVSTNSLENCTQPKPDKSLATSGDIEDFVALATGPGISAHSDGGKRKREFARLGQKILRTIVASMGLKAKEYTISYNPGGNAVCGDVTLRTAGVYVHFEQSTIRDIPAFYYRSCNADGRGEGQGPNRWMDWKFLSKANMPQIVAAFKEPDAQPPTLPGRW